MHLDAVARLGPFRTLAWLALCVTEALTISYLFEINATGAGHLNPVFYVTSLARLVMVAALVFCFVAWPDRARIARMWSASQSEHNAFRAATLNLVLFALLAAASVIITTEARKRGGPPWELVYVYLPFVLLTGLTLARIDVPLRSMLAIARSESRSVLISLATSAMILFISLQISPAIWEDLAELTLRISAWMLGLVDASTQVDLPHRVIVVGDFAVHIDASCSGYEGLSLIAGFVSIYLWTFRKDLRFPAAFLLYPIGLGAIWLLNSVRIASLAWIGGHLSPQVAQQGYHSQAGWITFLFVSSALMLLSRKLHLFTASPATGLLAEREQQALQARRQRDVYLVPFIAMMIGTIVMSATSPHDQPAYVVKAGLILAALMFYRRFLPLERVSLDITALLAGLAVGVLWIVSAPEGKENSQLLADWLQELPWWIALGWLLVRGVGTIILVPIAEELAFRGFLYRRLIASDFAAVSKTQLSLLALAANSALFGALHDRWFAAAASGVLFTLVMLRRGKLQDAITAHAFANAVIFFWALAARQWALL